MDSLDSFNVPYGSRVILIVLVCKVWCCLNKEMFQIFQKINHESTYARRRNFRLAAVQKLLVSALSQGSNLLVLLLDSSIVIRCWSVLRQQSSHLLGVARRAEFPIRLRSIKARRYSPIHWTFRGVEQFWHTARDVLVPNTSRHGFVLKWSHI